MRPAGASAGLSRLAEVDVPEEFDSEQWFHDSFSYRACSVALYRLSLDRYSTPG
jgi:hypothetical protein